jgi:hypothetical protein
MEGRLYTKTGNVSTMRIEARSRNHSCCGKAIGKSFPVIGLSGPKEPGRLRLPDFLDFRHYEGGKVVTPTHRSSLPQEVFLVLIFRGLVDPRAHGSVGSLGKNPQRHHWGSIPRPSD